MAKAKKQADTPPLRMKIEGGRLAPVTPWDAERIDTYRNGSEVNVYITQDRADKLTRKYFAILGLVVKQCNVKHKTTTALHDALKWELGYVEAWWTLDGTLKARPLSITDMDATEFEEFYTRAMDRLHETTGVDPLTLRKEAADVGEDPAAIDAEPDENENPAAPPAENDNQVDEAAAPEPSQPETSREPLDEGEWLKGFARAVLAATGVDSQFVTATARGQVAENPPSEPTLEKARAITKACHSIVHGEDRDKLEAIIASKAHCTIKELKV